MTFAIGTSTPEVKLTPTQERKAKLQKQQKDMMDMVMATVKGGDPTDSGSGLKPKDFMDMNLAFMKMQNNIEDAEDKELTRNALLSLLDAQDLNIVGKHIKQPSDKLQVTHEGGLISYAVPNEEIMKTKIRILDEKGAELLTLDGKTEKGNHRLQWDGHLDDEVKTKVKEGTYRVQVIAQTPEQKLKFLETYAYPRVQELEQLEDKKALLLQYADKSYKRIPYKRSADNLTIAAPLIKTAV